MCFSYITLCFNVLAEEEEKEEKRPSGTQNQGQPDTFTTTGSWSQDPLKSTMWLGTEDGW